MRVGNVKIRQFKLHLSSNSTNKWVKIQLQVKLEVQVRARMHLSPNSVWLVSRIVHAHRSLKDDDNKSNHGDFMITDHRKDIGKEDEEAEEVDKDRERKKGKRM